MHALAVLFGETDEPLRRDQRRLRIAPLGVRRRIALAAQMHSRLEAVFILGMKRCASRNSGDDAIERIFLVNQKVAGGRAHEDFHAGRGFELFEFRNFRDVVARTADEKCEIAKHAVTRAADLVGQRVFRRRQGLRVRHLENGRDAASDRGSAPRLEIFFMRQARLAEMHLGIDDPRQNMQARRVDDFSRAGRSKVADFRNPAARNRDIADTLPVMVDDCRATDQDIECIGHFCRRSSHLPSA